MSGTYVIAEMAYSHDGKEELALDIVDKAARSGANAISIHITHMPDYMVPNYGAGPGRVSAGKETSSIYDYLCEISLPFEAWTRIAAHARECGLDLIVMPNDDASLTYAESLNPVAYVIGAAVFDDDDFIARIGAMARTTYLRTGGATLGEIENVLAGLETAGVEQCVLLYGHQNYPTRIEDNHLAALPTLARTFNCPVGLADHVDAEDEFAVAMPLIAVAMGATCIEKHLTHDRAKRGEDHESALNADEFALLVSRLRKAEAAMGSSRYHSDDDSALRYRAVVRKRLVAARDIAPGEVLGVGNVVAKRADEGLAASRRPDVFGRRVAVAVKAHAGITFELFDDPTQ